MIDAIRLGLQWWYVAGWRWLWRQLEARLVRTSQRFSMLNLLRTLGAPYRQTFTASQGGLNLPGLLDNAVSRVVGLFVRLGLLLAGVICGVFWASAGLVMLLIWGFVPLLPLLAVGLTVGGWLP